MFRTILVPLDGSPLAERALQSAVAIADGLEAKLILLRVVPQFTILAADPNLYAEMRRLGEDETIAYLRSVEEALPPRVQVEVACEDGPAGDAIVKYAGSHNVDLIIMSSHGRSGVTRWVYGSVAEQVLRQAPCATMVTCANSEVPLLKYRRILVPLDGSELAEEAIDPALILARALEAELYLLRVTQSAHAMMETVSMAEVFDQIHEQEVAEAESYLQQKYGNLPNDHVFFEVLTAANSVADTIIDYTATHRIDLIVMSSHGRTGWRRLVYGSVAEKVLRGACCATLIVRSSPN